MGAARLPAAATPDPALVSDDTDHPDQVEKQASYPGEDTSFTSQRELNGWFYRPPKLRM